MKDSAIAERLQGQLIATNLLLEAVLRTLPAQTVKDIFATYLRLEPETSALALNSAASDAMLEAIDSQIAVTKKLLADIHRDAVLQESAHRWP